MDIRRKVENIGAAYDSPLPFNPFIPVFNSMTKPPISSYIRKEDLYALYQLATNPKYASNDMESRLDVYDAIMNPLGFKRSFSGTNRVIYSYRDDDSFLIKIGLDDVGIRDNKSEFKNQELIKPFIPKVYEVSQDGVVEMIERVHPIMSRKEFAKYGLEVFKLTYYLINHGFVLEDIGTDYFMNWGIRDGFGPVLLDFPYLYRLNKDRLRCTNFKNGSRCTGVLDYDEGYNHIRCSQCGQVYRAKDIGSSLEYLTKKQKKGWFTMEAPIKFTFRRGNKVVTHIVNDDGTDYITSETQSSNIVNNTDRPFKDENLWGKNTRNRDYETPAHKKPDSGFNTFTLITAYNKAMSKLKSEFKVDKFSNEVTEYVANYLITYKDQYICVPSVLLDGSTKLTDEVKESIKTRLTEQAGTSVVTGITEISIGGGFMMYITSKPIININKYMGCVADAVHRYYEEEQEEEEPVNPTDNNGAGAAEEIANVLSDIANDASMEFKSKVVTPYTTMELKQTKSSLGSGVIKASDAVEIPARQTYASSEF